MVELVSSKKASGWKVAIGVGLLLAPALAGAALGAEAQVVTSESVPAVEYGAAGAEAIGTADHPYVGPPSEGVAASQLISVTSETFGGTALVQILGDGSFEYAAFQLSDPARFVLDLPGVVKTTEQVSLEVGHDIVSHIRVGQYRAQPDPVSRVVFDLTVAAVPHIEPTPEGLAVSFDRTSLAALFPSVESESDAANETDLPAIARTIEPSASAGDEETEAKDAVADAEETQAEDSYVEGETVVAEVVAMPVAEVMAIPESAAAVPVEPILTEPEPQLEVLVARSEPLEVETPMVVAEPVREPLSEAVPTVTDPVTEQVLAVAESTEEDAAMVEDAYPAMSAEIVPPPETVVAAVESLPEPVVETESYPTVETAVEVAEPPTAAVEELIAETVLDETIEELPPLVEPQLFELPNEEPFELPNEQPIAEAEFQIAEVQPGETLEVLVEAMPEPEIPTPSAPPAARLTDTVLFDVANVQVEEPAMGGSGGSDAAAGFEAQSLDSERRYQGEPMDLSLQDADVKDVLRSFAQLSGLNVVVQPDVRGQVTVELVQVPWDQALEQILKINNLGYELDGNIMRIAKIETLRKEAEEQQKLLAARALSVPLSTVIRRVSYAKAAEVAGVLTSRGGLMSSRGTVIVDRRTNTLIIKELPSYMNTVITIIENLDIPEPQVMIEARIIETTKRFSRSLGIEWGFQGVSSAATGNTSGLEFPNNGTVDGGVNLLTGAQNGFINLSLGNILSTFNLDATLHAAESEGLINVLSAPRVATLNNEQASIQSGLQIPIQTVANNTVSVQFVNATLRLDVTPQVTAEGTILMDINIQKREPQLAFAVVGARNAPIATKEARTRVIVRDGGTTVIGGIYEVSTDQGEDRVPGLANIPLIKHLFKNKRRQDKNEELLIFITPRVTKL